VVCVMLLRVTQLKNLFVLGEATEASVCKDELRD
jgi:hypothetical protein